MIRRKRIFQTVFLELLPPAIYITSCFGSLFRFHTRTSLSGEKMQYRDFGKTGFKISALGFGAMRLPIPENQDKNAKDDLGPAVDLLRYGFEKGINYVDTAYMYCDGRSELAVGVALQDGWREKVKLSTKLPLGEVKKPDDMKRLLEIQLKKLDTDSIDFYHFHALSSQTFHELILPMKLIDLAEKFKSEGVIHHLSFSFHDAHPETIVEILDTQAFSSVLCQFNLLDRSNLVGIRHAAELGMGVVVMGPVGGGRLAFKGGVFENALGGKISTPELAIRFVLSTPGISCALSGMGTREMVDGNVAMANIPEPLSKNELDAIETVTEQCSKLKNLYCTGCGYCTPACPKKIAIPKCLEALIYKEVYNLDEAAKNRYNSIGKNPWDTGETASACIGCGACEKKCPQNIPIRERLRQCREIFGS